MENPVTWAYGKPRTKFYRPLIKESILPNGDTMEERFYDINDAIDYIRSTYEHSECYKYISLRREQSDSSILEWDNF